jgi:hypothetical protein
MSAWHASGLDSVVRDGTTNSMRVTVLVPIDRDAWRLADAEHAAMREACAVQVADALNRSDGDTIAVDRALVAELVGAIADLRGTCQEHPAWNVADARAQRLALTLAGLLEAKP